MVGLALLLVGLAWLTSWRSTTVVIAYALATAGLHLLHDRRTGRPVFASANATTAQHLVVAYALSLPLWAVAIVHLRAHPLMLLLFAVTTVGVGAFFAFLLLREGSSKRS